MAGSDAIPSPVENAPRSSGRAVWPVSYALSQSPEDSLAVQPRKKRAAPRRKPKNTFNPNLPCYLFALPAELRNEIYRYATHKSPDHVAHHSNPCRLPRFMLASKQTYVEALPVFYAENTHVFLVSSNLGLSVHIPCEDLAGCGSFGKLSLQSPMIPGNLGLSPDVTSKLGCTLLHDVRLLVYDYQLIMQARRCVQERTAKRKRPPHSQPPHHLLEVQMSIKPGGSKITFQYGWHWKDPSRSLSTERVSNAFKHEILDLLMQDANAAVENLDRSANVSRGFSIDDIQGVASTLAFDNSVRMRTDVQLRRSLKFFRSELKADVPADAFPSQGFWITLGGATISSYEAKSIQTKFTDGS